MDTDAHKWGFETDASAVTPPSPLGGRTSAGERAGVRGERAKISRIKPIVFLLLCALSLVLTACQSTSAAKASPVISISYESTYTYTVSKKSGQRITPGYDIFTDGRCSLRSADGDEITLKLSPEEVTGLVSFSKEQGFFSISNESLVKTLSSKTFEYVTNFNPNPLTVVEVKVISVDGPAMEMHGEQVTVSIQDGTLKNSISRYNLHKEIKHYTNLTQFQIIGRCLGKINNSVEQTWEKQRVR
ncbi:MAG: hypothetical protein K0Q55_1955 [Verrucomicrobia bacterium]|nr:hypothetical protein [Verrucomicrobiota bacterium]